MVRATPSNPPLNVGYPSQQRRNYVRLLETALRNYGLLENNNLI